MKKQNNVLKDGCDEINFWKEWIEADTLKRCKIIDKLPIFEMCLDAKDKKDSKRIFALLLNSYFEDLYNSCVAMYSKD